jgi:hypothetical protein
VEEVFAVIEERVAAQVADIAAEAERGEPVWPVIDYADVAAGTVSPELLAKLQRRGCAVIRGHFPREQALEWDAAIVDYVERNRFFETYRGPGDDFFGTVGSKPEIYPIYWSPAQMQARQERAHGPRAGVPQRPVAARVRGRGRGSSPTATASTPTGSAAGPRARTPQAWAPTSIPAPSTCG